MEQQFWKFIAYGLIISQTLSVIVILEFIIFGKPYITFVLLPITIFVYWFLRRKKKIK